MARTHGLHRFTLPAVRRAPEAPVPGVGDGVTGFPEVGRDSGIGTILQQASALAAVDLVSNFSSKLEVEAHVIDTPGPIGFHEDAVVGVRNDVLEIPGTGFDRHIGHPDQRYAVPTFGPHATVALQAEPGCRLARHQIADKFSIPHKRRARGRDSLIIPAKRSQTGPTDAVGGEIHDIGTVAEIVSLFRG